MMNDFLDEFVDEISGTARIITHKLFAILTMLLGIILIIIAYILL